MTYLSCIILGIGSVITFTSAVGVLGSVVEIKCLLVTVSGNQPPTFLKKKGNFVCMKKICSCLDVISTYKFVDRKTHLDKVLARMKSQHN